MSKLKDTILAMLTENTGKGICDSGGAYGRHWQRNQGLTVEDFDARPEAYLTVSRWTDKEGEETFEIWPRVELFHYLEQTLDLDKACLEFNALPVEDWDGEFYGVSKLGQEWLDDRATHKEGGFNSYNGESNLTQVIQGERFDLDGYDYFLLQIHGGCDVRGGYTDAKLFRLESEFFGCEDCSFSVPRNKIDLESRLQLRFEEMPSHLELTEPENLTLDWRGEFLDDEGNEVDKDYLDRFAVAAFANAPDDGRKSVTVKGSGYFGC